MVRMSDLLKKARERKKALQKSSEPKQPDTQPPAPQTPKQEVPSQPQPEVRISPVVTKQVKSASSEETVKLYEETLSLIREILKEDIDYGSIDTQRITVQIEGIINQFKQGNEEMLKLALITNPTDTHYLFHHSVNTCFLSIVIGLALGYGMPKLIELGISAFLYDIGMVKYLGLANQPRKLTIEEYNEIKNHPREDMKILEKIDKGLPKITSHVAYQHHERMDGSGYPEGIKGDNINEFAKIIAFADIYGALTHNRVYRPSHNPLEAIKIILSNKNSFDSKIIKLFLEKVGLYPRGTIVELNTKETAEIIKHNPKYPIAPKILVACDLQGRKLENPREIDLSTNPTIYITKCL